MGIVRSRASRHAAARTQADRTRYQLEREQAASQQARRALREQRGQQAQAPGMLAVAGQTVYLTPRNSPLALSPAEARWLANELMGAASAVERGTFGS